MNTYILLCKNTCEAGQGGHTTTRIYSLSLVKLSGFFVGWSRRETSCVFQHLEMLSL